MDAADGKKDGVISASVWNDYLDKMGSKGNHVKVGIKLENAIKSLTYYEKTKDKDVDWKGSWENNLKTIEENPDKYQTTTKQTSQTSNTQQTPQSQSTRQKQQIAQADANSLKSSAFTSWSWNVDADEKVFNEGCDFFAEIANADPKDVKTSVLSKDPVEIKFEMGEGKDAKSVCIYYDKDGNIEKIQINTSTETTSKGTDYSELDIYSDGHTDFSSDKELVERNDGHHSSGGTINFNNAQKLVNKLLKNTNTTVPKSQTKVETESKEDKAKLNKEFGFNTNTIATNGVSKQDVDKAKEITTKANDELAEMANVSSSELRTGLVLDKKIKPNSSVEIKYGNSVVQITFDENKEIKEVKIGKESPFNNKFYADVCYSSDGSVDTKIPKGNQNREREDIPGVTPSTNVSGYANFENLKDVAEKLLKNAGFTL